MSEKTEMVEKNDSFWIAKLFRSNEDNTPIMVKVNSITNLFKKVKGGKMMENNETEQLGKTEKGPVHIAEPATATKIRETLGIDKEPISVITSVIVCDECGAFHGLHRRNCTLQTKEQLLGVVNRCLDDKERVAKMNGGITRRLADHATFWQGKFRIVVHENNMLRKRVRRQFK
jgi:hypothetical protein